MIDENNNRPGNESNELAKPDSETLHTTDPQENMKGPVSSLMQETGESFDSDKTEEEADEERDNRL